MRVTLDEINFTATHLDDASDTEFEFESLLDSEKDTGALEDIVEDLLADVECLQELGPALERPSQDIGYDEEPRCIDVGASTITSLPFEESIQHKFPQASLELVKHLAEKNVARYLRLQEQRRKYEQREGSEVLQLDVKTVALSSKFHDSGFEGSVAPTKTYTSNVPSSVTSSATVRKHPTYPSLSDDAKAGTPFACTACGRMVSVQSESLWRQHLMSDLQPYVCVFPHCSFALPSTEGSVVSAWVKHFNENHHLTTVEEKQKCPLCAARILPVRFISHIAQHLENIALAALPREYESDSDSEFGEDRIGSKDYEVTEITKISDRRMVEQPRAGASSYWSLPEVTDFPKNIAHFGTDWEAIANHMGTKTQTMVQENVFVL